VRIAGRDEGDRVAPRCGPVGRVRVALTLALVRGNPYRSKHADSQA